MLLGWAVCVALKSAGCKGGVSLGFGGTHLFLYDRRVLFFYPSLPSACGGILSFFFNQVIIKISGDQRGERGKVCSQFGYERGFQKFLVG